MRIAGSTSRDDFDLLHLIISGVRYEVSFFFFVGAGDTVL